jgi:excisionase family DNA binding protein
MEVFLSVKQAAQRKGVSVSAIYKAIHDGRLPFTRIGTGFALKPSDVDTCEFGSYGLIKRTNKTRGKRKKAGDVVH